MRVQVRGRLNRQHTAKSKVDAERWANTRLREIGLHGKEGVLQQSEITEYREAKALARGSDLRIVARYWAEQNPEKPASPAKEVIDCYKSSPQWDALAQATRNQKGSVLKKFSETFGDTPLSAITIEAVENYLDEIPDDVTRNSHARILKTFFKWTTHRRNRYLHRSPLEPLELAPLHYGTPEFIDYKGVQRLFDEACETDTGMIPFLALGFFAGIRTDEILRLKPADIQTTDKRINVRAEVAKPKRKGKPLPRLIEGLPETLWKWLEAVDFDGSIDKTNYMRRRRELVQAAKIEWPNSAARHTFATYAYAHFNDGGKVRKWTGHRGGDSTMLTHYAGLETQEHGKKYFEILPSKKKITTIRPKSKAAQQVKWPPDQELKKLAWEKPLSHLAKDLNCSDQAIRKRCRKRGIESPKNGHWQRVNAGR